MATEIIAGFPPEIVSKIWKHMRLNDLLKSRLVSKSWNQQCLHVLTNSDFIHELNCTEAQDVHSLTKFLEFLNQYESPQFVLPFGLKFKMSHTCKEVFSPILLHQDDQEKLGRFVENVKSLISVFGSSCVYSFAISVERKNEQLASSSYIGQIFELVTMVSEGLVTLILEGHLFGRISWNEIKETVKFPKLKKVSLRYWLTSPRSPEHDAFWMAPFKKFPSLKEVHVKGWLPSPHFTSDWFWPIPIHLINSLSVTLTSETVFLENWKKENYTTWTLQNLVLDTRILKLNHSPGACDQVAAILSIFASTLQSLTLKFLEEIETTRTQVLIPFPQFPMVKFLKIKAFDSEFYHFILETSSFPILEVISVQYDMTLGITDSYSMPLNKIFPNMTSLILRIDPYWGSYESREYMENFQDLFPKLNKICFHRLSCTVSPGRRILEPYARVTRILKGPIQSKGANRIKEIELSNFKHNYIGIALAEIQMQNLSRHVVENDQSDTKHNELVDAKNEDEKQTIFEKLNCIKISMSSKTNKRILTSDKYKNSQNKYEALFGPNLLYLDLLTQNCFALRKMELSSLLFGKYEIDSFLMVQEIRDRFPNFIFKIK